MLRTLPGRKKGRLLRTRGSHGEGPAGIALTGREQGDCIQSLDAQGAEVCSAWRDVGGQGTLSQRGPREAGDPQGGICHTVSASTWELNTNTPKHQ